MEALLLLHGCVCWVSHERTVVRVLRQPGGMLLPLLCQPGERLCCVRLCHGCCSSIQERIIVSPVPTAPQAFLQPLSSHLAYPGSANSADSVNSKTSGITNRMKNSTQYNSIFLSILCAVAIILIYVYYKPQFIMLLFSLLMGICLLSNLRGNVVF